MNPKYTICKKKKCAICTIFKIYNICTPRPICTILPQYHYLLKLQLYLLKIPLYFPKNPLYFPNIPLYFPKKKCYHIKWTNQQTNWTHFLTARVLVYWAYEVIKFWYGRTKWMVTMYSKGYILGCFLQGDFFSAPPPPPPLLWTLSDVLPKSAELS